MRTTKLKKVTDAVVFTCGTTLTRFQAAEIAEYLLSKNQGDVARAVQDAASPYIIDGKPCY